MHFAWQISQAKEEDLDCWRVKMIKLWMHSWKKKNQMYTASVNDADSDKRSEDDMKYERTVEKRHEMAWKESRKCSGVIGTCSCM